MPEPAYNNEDLDMMSEKDSLYFETMDALCQSLIKKRDLAVAFRASSGIERRWREDEQLLEGSLDYPSMDTSMLAYATGEAPARSSNTPNRSMIEINIIRNKCEVAIGRFVDIMLPTDARNWGLKVTPVPELEQALKDERMAARADTGEPITTPDGQQVTMADIAKNELTIARDKMKLMELEIDDQLTECNYNGELRKVIKESVNGGTGIIRGPNVVKKLRKSYNKIIENGKEVYQFTVSEKHQPASECVSKWQIYPDPDTTDNVKETMGHIFERQDIRPSELFNLINIKGYQEKQILQVLKEKPKRTEVTLAENSNKYKTIQKLAADNDLYEMWIYYGDLNRDDLMAIDIDVSTAPEATMLSACVVMVNDRPIKVMLNTLDSGDLPYDFFSWSPISGSPWGIGLPRMMMWLQFMINGAMRAMMDNAGDSSGVNVVISSELSPQDDKYELTGKKLWRYTGEDPNEIDVRKLFAQFQVANNQQELQNIVELAFKLLDLETGVPMIFQGEQQKIPETLGATNIMVDANNVSLRSRVKLFDDDITRPHLTKYYHWNMQYNDNNEIKGDYNVDPRGTSVLLQRDQQMRSLIDLMQFKADPDFQARVDWDKAIKELFEILGLDVLRTDDQFNDMKKKQEQSPPKDPKITAAEIKSNADVKEVETRAAMTDKELAFKQQQAEQERAFKLRMKEMDMRIKMMEFAEKRNISLDNIKKDLAKESMKLKTQVQLTDVNGKAPQVATPAMEPPGRAANGEAFTG